MAERVIAERRADGAELPRHHRPPDRPTPSYTYELMFGCTGGDFCHGLLHPDLMGPFRPGPAGVARPARSRSTGLYLCGAGCHGGPGVTFIPGYNAGYAVLDAANVPETRRVATAGV